MSPFKKQNRANYYTAPTLPGWGRVGPWSTGTANRRQAEQMEAMLYALALELPDAIDALVAGSYSLPELYVAYRRGRAALSGLVELGKDPPLPEVIDTFAHHVKDRRILEGLTALRRLAPARARRSWLLVPKNISDTLAALVAEGQKPNSVRRGLYRAISDLLAYEVGKAEKGRILVDVLKPSEDDTRRVTLTPEELERMVAHLDPEMGDLATLAAITGADLTPLLSLTAKHFDEARGTLLIPDTKNPSRYRTLELGATGQGIVRRRIAARPAGAALWPLTRQAAYSRWKVARRHAGLPSLRIKDLRHVFGDKWVTAGGSMRTLKDAMGHTDIKTTDRYTVAAPIARREQMEAIERELGLAKGHLKAEKGGA